ncbi:hypothetical protein FRC14_008134 [Serendipita sp. 396]|nr:hypothetical protein FRC14_008134 [Serendipita sp. 396]KAG8768240.1 hypothetical protein FRC15_005248 [Serendipita sp. 397]KAG8859615.1 hypothetical protein FRC20_011800 [Serendipita sp. 405]
MSEETAIQLLSVDESSPDLTSDQLEGAASTEAETSIAAAQTSDSNQSRKLNFSYHLSLGLQSHQYG